VSYKKERRDYLLGGRRQRRRSISSNVIRDGLSRDRGNKDRHNDPSSMHHRWSRAPCTSHNKSKFYNPAGRSAAWRSSALALRPRQAGSQLFPPSGPTNREQSARFSRRCVKRSFSSLSSTLSHPRKI